MKVLVTGATGFIGKRLIERLRERGHGVVALTRDAARGREGPGAAPGVETVAWPDPEAAPPPASAWDGVDAAVHLAGEPVAGRRWSDEHKARIRSSRELGTRRLVEGIGALPAAKRPRVLISASAIGYYGDRGDEELTEASPPGTDFLADVCKVWEREADRAAAEHGVRVVRLRIGIVLGKGGGALAKMLTPFKLCIGGRLGSGRQWMSWIHQDDVCGLALHALDEQDLRGPTNAVAPNPATNRELTKALGRALGRPAVLPMPAFLLKLAVGGMAEVLLGSQRVLPKVAEATGYRFLYPRLEEALAAAVA